MPMGIFDTVSQGLAEALTLHRQRHEVLAANIANVETPGYRAQELEFKSALREAFEVHETPGGPSPRVVDRPSGTMRPDGNTVDVDMEMARLADNRGAYTTYADILARRLLQVRLAIERSQ
jgi:flagellar basal-body rod protein FlgB